MVYKFTKQEAFDKVVKHLVKQGRPAVGSWSCLYQTGDGLKCAAGCLVERKSVREKLEGDWWEVLETRPHLKNLADPKLVIRLQEAHDINTQISLHSWKKQWVVSMKQIAKDFKLKTTLLNKLATTEWVDTAA